MRNAREILSLLAALAVFVLTVDACTRDRQAQEEPKPVEAAAKATPAQPSTPTKPVTAPKASPPPNLIAISGQVQEVVDAGNFIFVLIDRGQEQTWATVPATDLKIGESISLENATLFGDFYSKSLDRSFKSLVFASGIVGKKPVRMASGDSKDPRQRRSGRLLGGVPPLPPTTEAKP